MIHTFYRVSCDECDYMSREFPTAMALDLYLTGDDDPDGKWVVTRHRRICAGCVFERACRIFGHDVRIIGYDQRPWCSRCDKPVAA